MILYFIIISDTVVQNQTIENRKNIVNMLIYTALKKKKKVAFYNIPSGLLFRYSFYKQLCKLRLVKNN